jgi:hypothetical protein
VIGVVPTIATTSSVGVAGDCVTVFRCGDFDGVAVGLSLAAALGALCIGGGGDDDGAGAGVSLFPHPANPIASGMAKLKVDKTTVVRCGFNGVTSVNESMSGRRAYHSQNVARV